MPIYEYRCASCGHSMDVLQKIAAPAPASCPECNKDAMEKQVTAAAFKLKGTGWYETDFKNKNKEHPEKKVEKKESAAKSSTNEKKTTSSGVGSKASK